MKQTKRKVKPEQVPIRPASKARLVEWQAAQALPPSLTDLISKLVDEWLDECETGGTS